ncbi:GbsR/MarR family transcriptional regulator [Pontibacillus litoralis]|uniref:HTH-type transcriptional regulator n=1 Tax=Pontibacillus litoralis JSM 072002 TaxID=1385512 RepID=A0A0A5G2F3_9BACI|nr:helix-turn-helix domain-containing protein [Pontibacillus litoralis]KGX85270.1 hypothetical protein N784_09525 [Pontibacillus litoralis JSM 072002]
MSEFENDSLLNKLRYETITEFAKTLEMFGLTAGEARLFVALYLVNEPMTLDNMSEMLAKSKTSMSTGIRTLVDLNLVERVWVKGVRKDLYKANDDIFNKFMSSFVLRWLDATMRQKASILEIKQSLTEDKHSIPAHQVEELNDRLHQIITFHNEISQALSKLDV